MSTTESMPALARVTKVRDQIRQLVGYVPVSVSGLSAVDGGWELEVDVVEVERIPSTASLLATYRVRTDEAGDVTSYERLRRFNRSAAD